MCTWGASLRQAQTTRTLYCTCAPATCTSRSLESEYATLCCARLACNGRYDTRLTEEGQAQAMLAGVDAKALSPFPEVLIASPLSRALHTAEIAFGNTPCPTIVEPMCSERIWLSSDVGRQPSELQQDFPTVDLDNLEDVWWHNNGSGNLQHVLAETSGNVTSTCMLTPCHKLHGESNR